ncbi:GNAT family N-acetyltransferase [Burkholderia sp. FERM BP-3421]|uniref:GNAT family N-acetyltransferase n=1 Tax=Burkholderia sp. FERM BP-3421 TaxID=1494466 RepID=UPI0023622B2B|nr:GNAT family N-acetyltransferase [Burkholderia sp. FERM BP-3421]WDD91345.1 GNAT family N-acetyltransferase [Burkholderia sp. FERM BP-3421]
MHDPFTQAGNGTQFDPTGGLPHPAVDSSQHTARIAVRRAVAADSETLAGLFRDAYGVTTHPCQSAGYIAQSITRAKGRWYVAESAGMVGCICFLRNTVNRTWELGHAVIDPAYRRLGVFSMLLRTGLEQTEIQSDEMVFAVTRSFAAYRALTKDVASILVGHDGGPNWVDSIREYHVTAIAQRIPAYFPHVAPPNEVWRRSPFIHDRVYAPLGLKWRTGLYPSLLFSGEGTHAGHDFTYCRDDHLDAIQLCGYRVSGDETQTADALARFMTHHAQCSYVSGDVLAHNVVLIQAMLNLGFGITAYLPAWHWHQGRRYDCVRLVRQRFDTINMNGFDTQIDGFDLAFQRLAEDLLETRELEFEQ